MCRAVPMIVGLLLAAARAAAHDWYEGARNRQHPMKLGAATLARLIPVIDKLEI